MCSWSDFEQVLISNDDLGYGSDTVMKRQLMNVENESDKERNKKIWLFRLFFNCSMHCSEWIFWTYINFSMDAYNVREHQD